MYHCLIIYIAGFSENVLVFQWSLFLARAKYEIWRTHKERGVEKVVVELSVLASICDNSFESYRCSCILPAVLSLKAGFHMIADDRRSQKVLRSSAIIWKHTSAIACDPAIVIADDRRRYNHVLSSAIVCDHLRSFAILRSYGNQSSAICDRNVSHNIFNSDR